jgi:hypothetical protein
MAQKFQITYLTNGVEKQIEVYAVDEMAAKRRFAASFGCTPILQRKIKILSISDVTYDVHVRHNI